jgi:predicted ArsR family transcriptional regulator
MAQKKDVYEKSLEATRLFLCKAHTAAHVAKKFGISTFAAYERINELCRRGLVSREGTDRARKTTGPKPALWQAHLY